MAKIFNFELLATYAIEKELRIQCSLLKHYDVGITIFKTEHAPKNDRRTVTIWFEIKTAIPDFWDLKPVIVIYEGHNLYLSDIRERTAEYFQETVKRIHRKLLKRHVPTP